MPFPHEAPPDGDYSAYLDRLAKASASGQHQTIVGPAAPPTPAAPIAPDSTPAMAPGPTVPKTAQPPQPAAATPATARRPRKRLNWQLILVFLFLLPLFGAARDLLRDGHLEGGFLLIVALFVVVSVWHSSRNSDKAARQPRRPQQDDDYPNTGH